VHRGGCLARARLYGRLVGGAGQSAYNAAQKLACECCLFPPNCIGQISFASTDNTADNTTIRGIAIVTYSLTDSDSNMAAYDLTKVEGLTLNRTTVVGTGQGSTRCELVADHLDFPAVGALQVVASTDGYSFGANVAAVVSGFETCALGSTDGGMPQSAQVQLQFDVPIVTCGPALPLPVAASRESLEWASSPICNAGKTSMNNSMQLTAGF
jgi:hypothetical protein